MRRYTFSFLAVTLVAAGVLGFVGCQGNTDGGEGANPDYRDDVFIGDETSTGSIRVQLNQSNLPVGQTAGFKVFVYDSTGQPIANTRVICDTEQGVALIEPTSGYELTNGDGVMSGVIGCAAPGSYQMVCRLSVGANRRQFVSVGCTGDVPAGFAGFPGAGGGGLGGGTQTNDDGEIQITDAGFDDDGDYTSTTVPTDASVDIVQTADCDVSTVTQDTEPFFDTYAVLNVENNLEERVTLLYLECSVTGVDGTSNTADCGTIGLTRASNSTLEANNDSTISRCRYLRSLMAESTSVTLRVGRGPESLARGSLPFRLGFTTKRPRTQKGMALIFHILPQAPPLPSVMSTAAHEARPFARPSANLPRHPA